MNDELISRKGALDALNHELRVGAAVNQCGLEMAYEVIEGLPVSQPSHRKGRWYRSHLLYGDTYWHCSICGGESDYPYANRFKYCPYCRAEMNCEEF